VDKWLANYHSKLAFLCEEYGKTLVVPLSVTVDEIVWYHSLRNDLYHAGNGLVPDEHSLSGARASALCVFSALFEVDAEQVLAKEAIPPVQPLSGKKAALPAQMLFLQSFIRLERTLASTLEIMGGQDTKAAKSLNLRKYWTLFASKGTGRRADYEEIIEQASRRVPKIENAEVMRGVTGVYDMTPDARPLLGQVPGVEGLYICAGFSGMGFKISPAIGLVMSELILDGAATTVDISAFRPTRFAEGKPIKAEFEYKDD